jgi:hypothetical protein
MIDQDKRSKAAEKQGVCHTYEENAQMYAEIPWEIKKPALAMLFSELGSVKGEIRKAYVADPKNWYIGYHFGWGMAVRNLLRQKGFGEKYFHVHNLDDIYIALVEEELELKPQ